MRPTQVRQRLLEYSRAHKRQLQDVLVEFAAERLMARLSADLALFPHLALKGGMLMQCILGPGMTRPTQDLDFGLSRRPMADHGLPVLDREARDRRLRLTPIEIVRRLADTAVDDGARFDASSIEVEPIRAAERYGGERLRLRGDVAGASFTLIIDIGDGDSIVPRPQRVARWPLIAELGAPELLGVPLETVVSEKLDAMLVHGLANSRLKDYVDLCVLAASREFDGRALTDAIAATAARRGRTLTTDAPAGLGSDYVERWRGQWKRRWAPLAIAPPELADAARLIASFVLVPMRDAAEGRRVERWWTPPGPWRETGAAR